MTVPRTPRPIVTRVRNVALIACSECGNQISDKAAACPQCGAANVRLQRLKRNHRQGLLVLLGVGVVVCLIGIVFLAAGNSLAAAHDNQNIVDRIEAQGARCTTMDCVGDHFEQAATIPTSDSDGHAQTLIGLALIPVGGVVAVYALIALAVSRGVRAG